MPAELNDAKLAGEAQKLAKEADETYQAAFDNYTTVADSSAADPDKSAAAVSALANEDRVMAEVGPLTGSAAVAAAILSS